MEEDRQDVQTIEVVYVGPEEHSEADEDDYLKSTRLVAAGLYEYVWDFTEEGFFEARNFMWRWFETKPLNGIDGYEAEKTGYADLGLATAHRRRSFFALFGGWKFYRPRNRTI